MPNTNEYHLYIHADELGGKGVGQSPVAQIEGNVGAEQEPQKGDSTQSILKRIVSYATVKGTVDKFIGYNISQISAQTGSEEAQQRIQTIYSTISSGVDTMISTAILGTVNPVLAAINLAGKVISGFVSYSMKAGTIDNQRSVESVGINMLNLRAGTTGRRST